MIKGKKGVFEFSMATAIVIILSIIIIAFGIILVNSMKIELPKIEKSMPKFFESKVYPEKGLSGTIFSIKIETTNSSFIYMMKIYVKKESSEISKIQMYDDGLHNDNKAGDGIYSGIFNSEGKKEGIYSIDLIINPGEKESVYENISKFMIFQNQCIPLVYNGDSDEKIDIAFLPSNYKDFSKFKNDALKLIDLAGTREGLFSYEPFKANKEKFNFYLINSTEDFECKLGCQGIPSLVCCNDEKVSKSALQCPTDNIFVLIDSRDFCGTASYYAKVCNAWNLGQVAVHEFGHVFGGLGDEYDYQKVYPQYQAYEANYPNCDIEKCPKWNSYWPDCVKGCGLSKFFRPTEKDCIMYYYTNQFDAVDQKTLSKLINNYENLGKEILAAPPQESYVIDFNYKKGELKEKNIYVSPSKAPDRKALRKFDYYGKIVSKDEKTLNVFKFEIPQILWPAMPRENETAYSPIIQEFLNHTISAPYFANANRIEIYNSKNQIVESIDVSYLSKTCGNGICEKYESSVDCKEDCNPFVKDKVCNYAQDNICDPDCPKVDSDCSLLNRINLQIVSVIIGVLILLVIIIAIKKKK